jgi:hypothetical protein
MNIERMLRLIAGFFIMLAVVLSQLHHIYWIYFAGFVGLNLFQSAFTNWCPMVAILKATGFKTCQEETRAQLSS